MNNNLFTIVLTNYNSPVLETISSIDSILKQSYSKIQLIITDDGSKNFNKKQIESYINKNKKSNIVSIDFIINNKNLGTVKTLNKAIKIVKGEYILFFGTGDMLAGNKVLKKFEEAFIDENKNIITSQWKICDGNLNVIHDFVVHKTKKYEKKYKKQLYMMCRSNLYGSGATCYRKKVFEKYGLFDEKYTLLEDWPFWLKLLFANETIYFEEFDGLLHRYGGVSTTEEKSNATKKFCQDMLNTYRYEIVPNLNRFNPHQKYRILESFMYHIEKYNNMVKTDNYRSIIKKYVNSNLILRIIWNYYQIFPNIKDKITILWKFNIVVPITAVLWIMTMIIINFLFEIENHNFYLLICILIYVLIYYITNVINNILIARKVKK